MQFETNADYPPIHRDRIKDPDTFPHPIIDQCESHTDRVLARGQIRLLKNIIIPILNVTNDNVNGNGDDGGGFHDDCSMESADSYSDNDDDDWLCRIIREAIYGHVWAAYVLKRSTTRHTDANTGIESTIEIWEMTEERCAVKVMSHHQIMEQRGAAEDPYKEVSAMQYLQRYHMANIEQQALAQSQAQNGNGPLEPDELRRRSNETMFDTHVMMPMDILTDNRNLYCVMPFCNGGELFDVLERRQKFSEDEA